MWYWAVATTSTVWSAWILLKVYVPVRYELIGCDTPSTLTDEIKYPSLAVQEIVLDCPLIISVCVCVIVAFVDFVVILYLFSTGATPSPL